MYVVDGDDRVHELRDLPQSSVGSPCPVVIATEHVVVVAYVIEEGAAIDASAVRALGPQEIAEVYAVVTFPAHAHMLGPPNDEAFRGHPLSERGLQPCGAFEVLNSSWVRALERMNRVHPRHQPERYSHRRHFVLSFHDSTFECVADRYQWQMLRCAPPTLVQELWRLAARSYG